MAEKKIKSYIKLNVGAGKANPGSVGSTLGQHGVKIPDFCNQFNDKTKDMASGTPIPVVITVYADRSFSFITKLPPVSYYIKQKSGLSQGSKEPGKAIVGNITMAQVKEIAELKLPDMNASDVMSAMNMVQGSARSMGIKVVVE